VLFHAAALTGRSVEHVLAWVANPVAAEQPIEVLRQHSHAARFWDGLLHGALTGSPDTVGNTVTTVQQAMRCSSNRRSAPAASHRGSPGHGPGRADPWQRHRVPARREDPYASASPLMTAVAEHVLDTRWAWPTRLGGRGCAVVSGLPGRTPQHRTAAHPAGPDGQRTSPGITFLYATQTWRQLIVCYGEDEARSLIGLTHNLVIWGAAKTSPSTGR